MTTGLDRLAAAVNGEPSDRIPVFCNLFEQGAEVLGMSIEEYYTKGEYVAEGQLRMREEFGYDIAFVVCNALLRTETNQLIGIEFDGDLRCHFF